VIPLPEILESLDVPAEDPSHRLLERLFHRFNARVPFETISKILRNADVGDPSEKPGGPETFWEEHLAWGAGGTCFSRVAAFAALLEGLGFRVEKRLGRVEADFDHAVLRVETERGTVLADVGFPLPALLGEAEGETESSLTGLSVRRSPRGWRVEFTAGVPDGPGGLEIFDAPVAEEEFAARWQATFRPDSRFLTRVGIRRTEGERAISFTRGEVRVDDRHSRLAVPLPAPRGRRIAEIFEMDEEALTRALSIAGDPPSEAPAARLTAYLTVEAPLDAAFAAIGSAGAYRDLLSGVAEVSVAEATPTAWHVSAAPPAASGSPARDAGFEEDVRADSDARRLEIRRTSVRSAFDSSFETKLLRGRTYLIRSVTFEGSREDLLRNDSARGRLAGTLAVDLLAWARKIR
jgi:hypothetical protein